MKYLICIFLLLFVDRSKSNNQITEYFMLENLTYYISIPYIYNIYSTIMIIDDIKINFSNINATHISYNEFYNMLKNNKLIYNMIYFVKNTQAMYKIPLNVKNKIDIINTNNNEIVRYNVIPSSKFSLYIDDKLVNSPNYTEIINTKTKYTKVKFITTFTNFNVTISINNKYVLYNNKEYNITFNASSINFFDVNNLNKVIGIYNLVYDPLLITTIQNSTSNLTLRNIINKNLKIDKHLNPITYIKNLNLIFNKFYMIIFNLLIVIFYIGYIIYCILYK